MYVSIYLGSGSDTAATCMVVTVLNASKLLHMLNDFILSFLVRLCLFGRGALTGSSSLAVGKQVVSWHLLCVSKRMCTQCRDAIHIQANK